MVQDQKVLETSSRGRVRKTAPIQMSVLPASQQVQDQHVEARDEHSSESSLSVKDYTKMKCFVSRVTKNRRRSRGQGRFACENCDRRYHQMKNLRRHVINECVESQYPAMLVFKHTCATCGKTYKHKHHLKRHHDFECGIDPKFKCAFCPHRTRYKDSLMKHILARHQHLLDQNSQRELQLVELDGADVAVHVECRRVHQVPAIHDQGRAEERPSLGPQKVSLLGLQSNVLVDGLADSSPDVRVQQAVPGDRRVRRRPVDRGQKGEEEEIRLSGLQPRLRGLHVALEAPELRVRRRTQVHLHHLQEQVLAKGQSQSTHENYALVSRFVACRKISAVGKIFFHLTWVPVDPVFISIICDIVPLAKCKQKT
ncbi:uncharacterized protein LOC143341878 isoform X2 [Colletes latitarsis]|uniref:uncharacterized protein LOC143341878 isoform X2 n=1 Tax=Colletes latitarsis TaxID=2605962 RepID=UPI004036A287